MPLYNVYRINEHGTPKKKMQIHALNIEAAWMGSKCWFINGLFLITNSDGTEAKLFYHKEV
jgi:hypothetical protein